MTANLTARSIDRNPFAGGFAMSGMNVRANDAAWRLATTGVAYGANHAATQIATRPLITATTATTTAQHQAIPAVTTVRAFTMPAAKGTKGSSPWRFPV